MNLMGSGKVLDREGPYNKKKMGKGKPEATGLRAGTGVKALALIISF